MAKTETAQAAPACALYLISPPLIDDLDAFARQLDQTLATGAVACLQLRLKDVDDDTVRAAAQKIMPICRAHDVAFILNDNAALALELDADGVHLGQDDGDVRAARTLLGPEKNIGVTCHDSRHLAFEAGDAGADYVAFGAFFDTSTKQTDARPDLDVLTIWDEVTDLPCVAIGGITVENCRTLADAGAHFVAVSSGVWNHPKGPVTAVKEFAAVLAS